MNCSCPSVAPPMIDGCSNPLPQMGRRILLNLSGIEHKAFKILNKKCEIESITKEPPEWDNGRNEIVRQKPLVVNYFYRERPDLIFQWEIKPESFILY